MRQPIPAATTSTEAGSLRTRPHGALRRRRGDAQPPAGLQPFRLPLCQRAADRTTRNSVDQLLVGAVAPDLLAGVPVDPFARSIALAHRDVLSRFPGVVASTGGAQDIERPELMPCAPLDEEILIVGSRTTSQPHRASRR